MVYFILKLMIRYKLFIYQNRSNVLTVLVSQFIILKFFKFFFIFFPNFSLLIILFFRYHFLFVPFVNLLKQVFFQVLFLLRDLLFFQLFLLLEFELVSALVLVPSVVHSLQLLLAFLDNNLLGFQLEFSHFLFTFLDGSLTLLLLIVY